MKIGAQLFTLRTYLQNEKDLGRALERVARIGYTTVQLSGLGSIPAKTVRHLCDENGLQIVLTHNPEHRFLNQIDVLIEEHQIYGCKYVGLGMMSEKYHQPHWLPCFGEDFYAPAQRLKEAGMRFMYHNHAFEFARMSDGRTLMDHLLDMFPADVMGITADTYWLQFAGIDVKKWLSEHAERLPCVHLKDMTVAGFENRMTAVGEGNLDFAGIMDILDHSGVTEYALVEQDHCYGLSPFDCMEKSYRHLNTLGYR
ncbi:MAG: sugar phosphate isomerase/epimerase [Clostridia bacterium]|nr:sugar phosphate isomerase/epimerase [Clostridia bacterium]